MSFNSSSIPAAAYAGTSLAILFPVSGFFSLAEYIVSLSATFILAVSLGPRLI